MAIPAFLKKVQDTVYYSGKGELLYLIPENYFDKKIAVITGEYVEVLGILDWYIKLTPNETIDPKKIRPFNFPSKFSCKPSKIEKVKDFAITNKFTQDYRILYFTNNDVDEVISCTKVPEDIDNVEDLFRLFVHTGSIPHTIKYHDIYKYFLYNFELSGNSYGLSNQLFGVLVSELCRDPKDINKPFRLSSALDEDPYSYINISIKDVPKLVSPFSSLTSENFDEAVVGAIMNKNNESVPLERVLMG